MRILLILLYVAFSSDKLQAETLTKGSVDAACLEALFDAFMNKDAPQNKSTLFDGNLIPQAPSDTALISTSGMITTSRSKAPAIRRLRNFKTGDIFLILADGSMWRISPTQYDQDQRFSRTTYDFQTISYSTTWGTTAYRIPHSDSIVEEAFKTWEPDTVEPTGGRRLKVESPESIIFTFKKATDVGMPNVVKNSSSKPVKVEEIFASLSEMINFKKSILHDRFCRYSKEQFKNLDGLGDNQKKAILDPFLVLPEISACQKSKLAESTINALLDSCKSWEKTSTNPDGH